MGWTFILKLIVTILTFAIAAIEFDFLKKNKKETTKKRWIGILFISLILFTVWDTSKESYDNSKAEFKRDSLITVDSLRAAQILTNLEINLGSISDTRNEIMAVDSLLGRVRDTLQNQVALLNQVVNKSKELLSLETKKFSLEKPNLDIYDIKIVKNIMDTTEYELSLKIINYGKRIASQIEYSSILVPYNAKTNQKNIYLPTESLKNRKISEILGEPGTFKNLIIKFHFNKLEVVDTYGSLFFIARLKYLDASTNKIEDSKYFFNAKFINKGDETFYDANPTEIKWVSDYLNSIKFDFPL